MIRVLGVSKKYRTGEETVHALREVSVSIRTGELAAILGPSGCGKTTLLNVIGQIVCPDEGSVKIFDTELAFGNDRDAARFRNETFGYLVQDFALVEQDTVFQNVRIPLIYSKRKIHSHRQRVLSALEEFEMGSMVDYLVSDLSGGQRQRVALARAIVNEPKIILADEPTGSLDLANKQKVFAYLQGLAHAGRTVVIVTHDLELAQKCDVVYTLRDGALETNSAASPS